MITVLKQNNDGSYDVVADIEVKVGGEFFSGKFDKDKKPISIPIKKIHEQRKERGIYKNEADRRNWARVS